MVSYRYFVTVVFIIFTIQARSQVITLRDNLTGLPIEKMALHTPSLKKYAVSDQQGQVSLSIFSLHDTIIFQHQSYKRIVKTKEDILSEGPTIYVENKVILLEASVISASRWEQNREEVPNRIEKINPVKAEMFNPQTTADLLGSSEKVFIQKSQMGGGSPMIRGFAANALLIMVDGIRMNNAIFRSGNLQNVIMVDPNAIQSAEVIFGPGTVIYGSDALGGVMDFHTLHPSLSTSDKLLLRSNGLVRYSSASNERTVHADVTWGKKKISGVTSVTWSDFGDLKMGHHLHPEYQRPVYVRYIDGVDSVFTNSDPNVQVPSGYQQINLLQKIRYRPTDKLDLTFSLHYSTSTDIPRYDRLIQYKNDLPAYANWYYGPQEWLMPVITLNVNASTFLYDHLKINAAYQYMVESRHDRKFGNDELRHRAERVNAGNVTIDFEKNLSGDKKSLFYGLESHYNDVRSTGYAENIFTGVTSPVATRYPDGFNHYYAVAGYLVYKQNIKEGFTLNMGGRWSKTGLHSGITDTSFYHFPFSHIDIDNGALNGSVGIVYHPGSTWQFNLNLSSGFRAPNLDDAGKVFDSEPGKVIVPNDQLKPEYLYNVDFGILRKKEEGFSFEITGFASYLYHAMVRRPFTFGGYDSLLYDGVMSEVEALTNAGYATIFGTSVSGTLNLPAGFAVSSTLTATTGKDNDGYPLRHAAPLFGASHITWETGKSTVDLYAQYSAPVPYDKLAPSEQSKPYMYATDSNGNPYSPGWTTLNIMSRFRLPWNLLFQAGIENILDIRYRSYSSGIVAPGRNLVVALRYQFANE